MLPACPAVSSCKHSPGGGCSARPWRPQLPHTRSHFHLFKDKEQMWLEQKAHPKSPLLVARPNSKNAPIQVTPVSLMGKMIPDVPRDWRPAPVSCRKLFLERHGELESWLLAFDITSPGGQVDSVLTLGECKHTSAPDRQGAPG